VNQIAETAIRGDQFSDDGPNQCIRYGDMHTCQHRTHSRGHNHFQHDISRLPSHEEYCIDEILVNVAHSGKRIEEDQEENRYRSEDDLHLYINTEPQNEERSKRNLWNTVDRSDERIKDFCQYWLNSK